MRTQRWLFILFLAFVTLFLAACGDDDNDHNNQVIPAAPIGVTATGGFNQVTISWNAVSNAATYNIYWSTAPGVTTATGTKITNAPNPYVQTDVTADTTYYYIVTAVNSAGEGPPSDEVSATPTSSPTVPVAPSGVTATAGTNQVTVSWTAVSDATSYNLYWATTTGVSPANGTLISNVTSPYVQTGLAAGTTYYYVVTAVNAVGESAPSAQASATPSSSPTVPAAPTGVTAAAGVNQVTISWTPVSGATSYHIYWSTTSGVTPANGTEIPNATSPYTQTGLTAGTAYYYVVTAENAVGESTPSSQVTATPTAPPAVPAAPTGVNATAGTNQVTISWSPVSGATSYNIYWSTSTGVTPANGTEIANVTSPYVHMGLTAGTAYYYVVTAVNSTGESAPSAEVAATPTSTATVPAAPTGVTATAGVNEVSLSWTAVSGATSYNIYWATSTGVTPATGTQIANATSPFVQTGLTAGTTYYYVVTAVNSVGEGAPSTEASATPTSTPAVPATPTGVTATAGNNQVTISWTAVSGATSYNIYWSTTAGVTPSTGTAITNATSPYVQTGLTAGTTYYYVVTAANGVGESAPSTEVSATPTSAPAVPPAPTGVVATGGTNSVTISWSAVGGATSYNLYWSTTAGVTPASGTQISNATSPYVHQLLSAGTTYYYVVTAVNGVGEGSPSAEAMATTSTLDGVSLYAANCAGCHGALATSSKRGRTAAQIQAAIDGNVGGMGFLSTLTPAQVQAIADVLNL